MGFLTFLAVLFDVEARIPVASMELFHVSHASHILFSAVTMTALFWKHEKTIAKAMVVGLIGSIVIGTLSDALFPYVGARFLGVQMHLHVDIIEHPWIILPFAVVGVLGGFLFPQAIEKSTQYTHSMHIFISSAASILYLMSFGMTEWIHQLGAVLIITLLAVMIPCCLSDIVFPLCCAHRNCTHD
jgi:hypothetical protein